MKYYVVIGPVPSQILGHYNSVELAFKAIARQPLDGGEEFRIFEFYCSVGGVDLRLINPKAPEL